LGINDYQLGDFKMKRKLFIIATRVGLGILAVVISGCTGAYRTDLVESGVFNIEQQRTGKVYIAWSDAYKENGGFVITGVLRRRDHVGGPIKAHVDITVLSSDGTILNEARSSDVYVSRRITGRSYLSFERFKVRFPNIPPKGSSIRLVSHSGRHNDTTKS
jgi:hypothetical protein